jgi:hypothetical protein
MIAPPTTDTSFPLLPFDAAQGFAGGKFENCRFFKDWHAVC